MQPVNEHEIRSNIKDVFSCAQKNHRENGCSSQRISTHKNIIFFLFQNTQQHQKVLYQLIRQRSWILPEQSLIAIHAHQLQ